MHSVCSAETVYNRMQSKIREYPVSKFRKIFLFENPMLFKKNVRTHF